MISVKRIRLNAPGADCDFKRLLPSDDNLFEFDFIKYIKDMQKQAFEQAEAELKKPNKILKSKIFVDNKGKVEL